MRQVYMPGLTVTTVLKPICARIDPLYSLWTRRGAVNTFEDLNSVCAAKHVRIWISYQLDVGEKKHCRE
jgi:hypothetical protein